MSCPGSVNWEAKPRGEAGPQGDCDPLRWRPRYPACPSAPLPCPGHGPGATLTLPSRPRLPQGGSGGLIPCSIPAPPRTRECPGSGFPASSGVRRPGAEVPLVWVDVGGDGREEAPMTPSVRTCSRVTHTHTHGPPRSPSRTPDRALQSRTQIHTEELKPPSLAPTPHTSWPIAHRAYS